MKVRIRFNAPPERRTTIATKKLHPKPSLAQLERVILKSLDTHKAEDIVSINLEGKSDFADRMIVASGNSQRQIAALADYVVDVLKNSGYNHIHIEGQEGCEWVLVDAGDIIVHLFKPEVRGYYNLEKMWSVSVPSQAEAAY